MLLNLHKINKPIFSMPKTKKRAVKTPSEGTQVPPVHPGIILKKYYIDKVLGDRSTAKFSRLSGIGYMHLVKTLKGELGISTNVAMRLGVVTGTGPLYWIMIQAAYDVAILKDKPEYKKLKSMY